MSTDPNKELAAKNKQLGNEAMKQKQYVEAIKAYTTSVSLDSTEPTVFANRALAEIYLRQYEQALSDCSKAIELNGGYLKAYHRRAEARLELGDAEQAEKDIMVVLRAEPKNENALELQKKIKGTLHFLPPSLSDLCSIEKKLSTCWYDTLKYPKDIVDVLKEADILESQKKDSISAEKLIVASQKVSLRKPPNYSQLAMLNYKILLCYERMERALEIIKYAGKTIEEIGKLEEDGRMHYNKELIAAYLKRAKVSLYGL